MKNLLAVFITVIASCCLIKVAECSNILVFAPYPVPSHHMVYWPLLKELVKRGHNVTMLSPLTMKDPPSSRYKELKIKNYLKQLKDLEDTGFKMSSNQLIRFFQSFMFFMRMGKFLTERILEEPTYKWLLESDSQFDLIIGEWTFSQETFAVLHHRFGAINVELSSYGNAHWTYWLYGQPYDTSYIADITSFSSDRMSFFERFQNNLQSLATRVMCSWYYMPWYQELMDRHIRYPGWENRPGIIELLRNTSLVLMNTHYSLNYPYPNAPHFKEIGGINLQPPEPLPNDIQQFMDESKDGVIFFSIGSFLQGTSVLDENVQKAFIQVFGRLKQRVLWKWESTIENLPQNVKTASWLPQQSILAHKNCKLFISHAGFLSLTETVYYGVPVVAIPIWADQPRNARQMTSKGYAVVVNFNNLTEESIEWALNEVLNNPKYKEKVMEQWRIYRDKPESALETAVYWTEYVIRNNGAHYLRPAIVTMPWYQQAMLDVYSVMAAIALLPLYITYIITKCLCKYVRKYSSKPKPKKKKD